MAHFRKSFTLEHLYSSYNKKLLAGNSNESWALRGSASDVWRSSINRVISDISTRNFQDKERLSFHLIAEVFTRDCRYSNESPRKIEEARIAKEKRDEARKTMLTVSESQETRLNDLSSSSKEVRQEGWTAS
jgi:hypothetical protein